MPNRGERGLAEQILGGSTTSSLLSKREKKREKSNVRKND